MILQFSQLNKTGKRENNEDSIYPKIGEKEFVENLFLVCDGVGGAEKGEVASSIACETVAEFVKKNTESDLTDEMIQATVQLAEKGMSNYIEEFPGSKGMATTLTMLYFNKDNAVIAHCGDSRVYHIRNGQILFQTRDHSLVNELLSSGFIESEKEAQNHPKKNIITRALNGENNSSAADVRFIPNDEIFENDFFFLCSDGVLESLDKETLEKLFTLEKSPVEIITEINVLCEGISNDNYSAIVVKFSNFENNNSVEDTKTITASLSDSDVQFTSNANQNEADTFRNKSGKPVRLLVIIFALMTAVVMLFWFLCSHNPKNESEKTPKINSIQNSDNPKTK